MTRIQIWSLTKNLCTVKERSFRQFKLAKALDEYIIDSLEKFLEESIDSSGEEFEEEMSRIYLDCKEKVRGAIRRKW